MLSPSSSTLPIRTVGTKVGLSMSTSCRFLSCAIMLRDKSQKPKTVYMNLFTLQKYEKVESKLPTIKIIFYTFVL